MLTNSACNDDFDNHAVQESTVMKKRSNSMMKMTAIMKKLKRGQIQKTLRLQGKYVSFSSPALKGI